MADLDRADLREEQEFLDRAHRSLDRMRDEANGMLHSVLDLGRGGTFQSRTERDIVVRTSLARLAQLDIGDQALCFGRIDRLVDGRGEQAELESFHIGRLAVSGPDHEPLVVDWRAPVAEPFYRATGLDPQGLARRRHLAVRGRQVIGVEDEYFVERDEWPRPEDLPPPGDEQLDGLVDRGLVLGGPGALLAALGAGRTGRMGDIVATIQREQDEIIRSPLAGVLLVQGGPGTGKTAVALHRAAYLLYTHRFPLERQGVLVVGPNPLFLRYIEEVLPSLGETGVTLSTVAGLVPEIQVRGSEPAEVARLKGDARMVRVVARAVRTRQRPLPRDVRIPLGATILRLDRALSEELVTAARRRRGTHNARRRFLETLVVERFAGQLRRSRTAVTAPGSATGGDGATADVGAEAADDQVDLADLRRQLRQVPAYLEALDRMWPRLDPHELLHDLFGARPLLAAAGRGVLSPEEVELLYRPRSASLDAVRWTPADVALVDEARTLLGPRSERPAQPDLPPEGYRSYGHIVVDEVQGLSAMELRMLERRSLSGSMTVVGDIAQGTGPSSPESWEEVTRHLSPSRPTRMVELTVSYRTPAEVIAVAERVLREAQPGLEPPTPARRSGVTPRAVAAPFSELGATTARVVAEELRALGQEGGGPDGGRTAVLAPEGLLAGLRRSLVEAGLDPVDPRQRSGQGLAAPLVLLPVDEANGLEFDAVVVVEPWLVAGGLTGREERPVVADARGMRTLYVALTRPTRRLAVVHAHRLPAALSGLPHPD